MARLIDADAINYIEIGKGKIEIALASDIDKIPTISPDEVRGVGEWERINYMVGHDYKCLACGKLNDRASNYCPDCGKPMRMKGADA